MQQSKSRATGREKLWTLLHPDPSLVQELSQALNITPLTSRLLINRGVTTVKDAKLFMQPTMDQLSDPFLMAGMTESVARLRTSLANGDKILIFGDDDVDGITSTSLLFLYLKRLGANVHSFIPQRYVHGPGLTTTALDAALEEFPANLLITTDCGVSSVEEIRHMANKGIDTIVVDHHTIPPELPPAKAILNPLLPGNAYPFTELAAVGVTFHFIRGLQADLKRLGVFSDRAEPKLVEYLDLVSLGTVADVVPLLGENRMFVHKGLSILRRRRRCGTAALLERSLRDGQKITERTICYRLAPRLNAAGRVGNANLCVELLTTNRYGVAQRLAKQLDRFNVMRQEAEASILTEAIEQAQEQVDAGRRVLVVFREGWNQGVLGIVASRILERFNLPTLLIAMADGRARGSARSPAGVNILEYMRACHDTLSNYGGHHSAAGLTLKAENVPFLSTQIEEEADRILENRELPTPQIKIDAEVGFSDLNPGQVRELERLAPFGFGNQEPAFLVRQVKPLKVRVVGRNHLRMRLRSDRSVLEVIGFSMGDTHVPKTSSIDVVLTPRIASKKPAHRVELQMLALRPTSSERKSVNVG